MIVVDASVWLSYLVESNAHHATSRRWLDDVMTDGEAIARQTGEPVLGQNTIGRLLGIPNLRLVSVDHAMGNEIARVAAAQCLSGADASYGAVAAESGVLLVSWDKEQLARAGLVTAIMPE